MRPNYSFQFQLAAGSVDEKTGVIKSATVGKLGVKAVGKFLLLDKSGKRVFDEDKAARKLPVMTDDITLSSMMTAIQAAGGKLKTRSDHDDSLSARAGYASNFTRESNRVCCDIYLNESYKDRAIVLETAVKDPTNIGLSVDIDPSFKIENDVALLRIDKINAVDIVDAGAITPDGLFLSQSVDKDNITEPKIIMSQDNKIDPLVAIMEHLTKLSESVAKLSVSVAETDKKIADASSKMAESAGKIVEDKINVMKSDQDKINAKLGITAGKEKAAVDGTETIDKGGEKMAAKKTLRQVVDEMCKADKTLSRSMAWKTAMQLNPELEDERRMTLGIVKAPHRASDPMKSMKAA